jgi:hypothetical protein
VIVAASQTLSVARADESREGSSSLPILLADILNRVMMGYLSFNFNPEILVQL